MILKNKQYHALASNYDVNGDLKIVLGEVKIVEVAIKGKSCVIFSSRRFVLQPCACQAKISLGASGLIYVMISNGNIFS